MLRIGEIDNIDGIDLIDTFEWTNDAEPLELSLHLESLQLRDAMYNVCNVFGATKVNRNDIDNWKWEKWWIVSNTYAILELASSLPCAQFASPTYTFIASELSFWTLKLERPSNKVVISINLKQARTAHIHNANSRQFHWNSANKNQIEMQSNRYLFIRITFKCVSFSPGLRAKRMGNK